MKALKEGKHYIIKDGLRRVKSVHTREEDGKYPTAVYRVNIPFPGREITWEDVLENCWVNSYGKTVVAYDFTPSHTSLSFMILDVNETSSARSDHKGELDRRLGVDATVTVAAALPEAGSHPHEGSPRKGTKREMKNAPHSLGATGGPVG